jgi:hypothetical protein
MFLSPKNIRKKHLDGFHLRVPLDDWSKKRSLNYLTEFVQAHCQTTGESQWKFGQWDFMGIRKAFFPPKC